MGTVTAFPGSEGGRSDPDPARAAWVEESATPVLRVTGEIDLSNARKVLGPLKAVNDRDVVVDLTGVDFMDSTGLAVLAEMRSETPAEVRLVVRADGQVHRLLDLTGLESRFAVDVVGGEGS